MVYTLRFFSSKCNLFHNSNVFGSCIIYILYTGCAEIKKNNSGAKRLSKISSSSRYFKILWGIAKVSVCHLDGSSPHVTFIHKLNRFHLSQPPYCACGVLTGVTTWRRIVWYVHVYQITLHYIPKTINSFTCVPLYKYIYNIIYYILLYNSHRGHGCLLWVLCVVRYRSLRRADHSSRGILQTVMRSCVWSWNLKNEEAIARIGPQRQLKKNYIINYYILL